MEVMEREKRVARIYFIRNGYKVTVMGGGSGGWASKGGGGRK